MDGLIRPLKSGRKYGLGRKYSF